MAASLQNLVGLYLLDYCAGKSDSLKKNTRSRLKPLLDHFTPARTLASISRQDMEGLQNALLNQRRKVRGGQIVNAPLSLFTIDSRMRTYRALFNWAVRRGLLKHNPMDGMHKVRRPKKAPAAIEQGTVDKLLRSIERGDREPWMVARDVAIVYCLRDTGARVGGLANATTDDLHLSEQRLYVFEKGAKGREVYLSEQTRAKLSLYLELRQKFWGEHTAPALFIGRSGQALLASSIYGVLRAAAQRAGIESRFNPHSFRHAFARDMLKAGADLSRVSQLMGHSSVAVTGAFYARWTDAELKAAHTLYSPVATQMGGQSR